MATAEKVGVILFGRSSTSSSYVCEIVMPYIECVVVIWWSCDGHVTVK